MNDHVVFHNGTVFDGTGFPGAGTTVRIENGPITEVGDGLPLDGAEPVDIDGGTLLPGFIDAHAHPVFAGNQLRPYDLRQSTSVDGYLQTIREYARTPDPADGVGPASAAASSARYSAIFDLPFIAG